MTRRCDVVRGPGVSLAGVRRWTTCVGSEAGESSAELDLLRPLGGEDLRIGELYIVANRSEYLG